jgi:hypothetical protein
MRLIWGHWKHIMIATTLGATAANSYILVRRSFISIKRSATCRYRARTVKSLALVKVGSLATSNNALLVTSVVSTPHTRVICGW